jgi:hypothetical protein
MQHTTLILSGSACRTHDSGELFGSEFSPLHLHKMRQLPSASLSNIAHPDEEGGNRTRNAQDFTFLVTRVISWVDAALSLNRPSIENKRQNRHPGLDQQGRCPGSVLAKGSQMESSPAEALPNQSTARCCVDRLSRHDLTGMFDNFRLARDTSAVGSGKQRKARSADRGPHDHRGRPVL